MKPEYLRALNRLSAANNGNVTANVVIDDALNNPRSELRDYLRNRDDAAMAHWKHQANQLLAEYALIVKVTRIEWRFKSPIPSVVSIPFTVHDPDAQGQGRLSPLDTRMKKDGGKQCRQLLERLKKLITDIDTMRNLAGLWQRPDNEQTLMARMAADADALAKLLEACGLPKKSAA